MGAAGRAVGLTAFVGTAWGISEGLHRGYPIRSLLAIGQKAVTVAGYGLLVNAGGFRSMLTPDAAERVQLTTSAWRWARRQGL